MITGFTSFCSELAKDLKKFLGSKIRKSHSIIRKSLGSLKDAEATSD